MSELENEQAETEEGNAVSEAGEPTPDDQAPGSSEPTQTGGDAQEGAPQPVTQGDLRPDDDEHPVDTTPPQSQDQPNTGREPGDPHEPMDKSGERDEPNERRAGGGDDTIWNG